MLSFYKGARASLRVADLQFGPAYGQTGAVPIGSAFRPPTREDYQIAEATEAQFRHMAVSLARLALRNYLCSCDNVSSLNSLIVYMAIMSI